MRKSAPCYVTTIQRVDTGEIEEWEALTLTDAKVICAIGVKAGTIKVLAGPVFVAR